MEDYVNYLNALQSSNLAEQITNARNAGTEQKQQALQPLGELLETTGLTSGLKEGLGAVGSAIKSFAIDKVKDVARQALTKAGIDEETINKTLAGKFDEAAKGAVNKLLDQAKSKVEDIKAQGQSIVEDAQDKLASTVSDIQAQGEEALNTIAEQGSSLASTSLNEAQSLVASGQQMTSGLIEDAGSTMSRLASVNAAKQFTSRFGDEFEDGSDLLEEPTTLSSTIRGATSLATNAESMAQNLATNAETIGQNISGTVVNALEGIAPKITSIVAPITEEISGTVANATSAISGIATTISQTASQALSTGSSALSGGLAAATGGETASTGAISGALAGIVGEETASSIIGAASAALGPIGIIGAVVGGIVSLVEGFKHHEQAPVLNPATQFL